MSFLEELKRYKRKTLKSVETRVTTCDGRQYIEEKTPHAWGHKPAKLCLSTDQPGYVVDYKPDLQVGVVDDFVLIGSLDTAYDAKLLTDHNVTHILTTAPIKDYKPPITVKHLTLDMLDLPETKLADYLSSAVSFIESAKADSGRVLVHCNAGISRSASIVIGYLMLTHKMSYDEAFAAVQKQRPSICPNIGFILQLQQMSFDQ